jgi:hypothetical protein
MYDAANLVDSLENLSVFNGKSIDLVELHAVKVLSRTGPDEQVQPVETNQQRDG